MTDDATTGEEMADPEEVGATPSIEHVPTYDDALLRARGVETGYGDLQILYGVDVDVRADEIVLVFGPNGAGKSTLIKCLYGLLPRWSGSIHLNDDDLTDVPADEMATRGVGYVPQRENVFPNLSISDNLDIGGIAGVDTGTRKEELYDLFPALEEKRGKKAHTLSGGQRQMLALARALMADPDVLFVDEPSAGLAPQLVEQAFDHIRQVNRAGTAVLMIEQNVKEGLALADRAYALDQGKVRYEGTADQMLDSEEIGDLYMGN